MRPGAGSASRHEGPLGAALDAALAPWKETAEPFTLLFSGGVDSGLLAFELRSAPGLRLVTVGRPGSRDLAAAETAARLLGLRWSGRLVADADLARLNGLLSRELEGAPSALRGVFLGLAVGLDAAGTTDVLLGQGADELFLGYAHFRGLDPVAAADRSLRDLRRLVEEDGPRTARIADRLGRRVSSPYLTPAFREAALAIPIEERLPVPVAKSFLREWAARRGVPAEIADRPKVALQYGTDVARWLRGQHPARGPSAP